MICHDEKEAHASQSSNTTKGGVQYETVYQFFMNVYGTHSFICDDIGAKTTFWTNIYLDDVQNAPPEGEAAEK